jgi:hypothetical protein
MGAVVILMAHILKMTYNLALEVDGLVLAFRSICLNNHTVYASH